MSHRVVITGMGWVTPLGHGIEDVWRNMLASQSAIRTNTLFEASTYPTTFGAQVAPFRLEDYLGADLGEHATCNRNAGFALAACEMAWQMSGLPRDDSIDRTSIGVYLGAGEGPIDFDNFAAAALAGTRDDAGDMTPLDTVRWAKTALQRLTADMEREQEPNQAASHIACRFNCQGPNLNTLTACAASTQAMGEATQILRRGDASVMISGGAHSMLHPLGLTGFNRLTALSTRNASPESASRPFDRTRDGFVLGEGAGILVLETLAHAQARGADILAEVIGYGSTADAFRITDIHEDGRGGIAAMNLALKDAGVTPRDVNYISAHGTGTEENDKIETLAIKGAFGEHASSVPVSSVKSMIGHLIAAAGAVELITCILAIRDGMIPPTINYETPDPRCDLDYVPNKARKHEVNVAMSNSFGFGGQNDTLVVRRFEG